MHHQMSGGVQLAPYIVSRLLVDSTSTSSCTAAPMGATRSPGAFGWLGSSAATFDAVIGEGMKKMKDDFLVAAIKKEDGPAAIAASAALRDRGTGKKSKHKKDKSDKKK